MKLSRSQSQLLVIDIQERLAPVMAAGAPAVELTQKLLRCAGLLGIPVTLTEQYRKGIGPTLAGVLEAAGAAAAVFEKMAFSAMGDAAITAHLRGSGRDQVVIAGIESHVCVLQTALDLHEAGLKPVVVIDAVASRAVESKQAALHRLRAHGVELVTTEMVIFEWLERAGTDDFRAILPLLK
jgi:nicotinamidase-related amidase